MERGLAPPRPAAPHRKQNVLIVSPSSARAPFPSVAAPCALLVCRRGAVFCFMAQQAWGIGAAAGGAGVARRGLRGRQADAFGTHHALPAPAHLSARSLRSAVKVRTREVTPCAPSRTLLAATSKNSRTPTQHTDTRAQTHGRKGQHSITCST